MSFSILWKKNLEKVIWKFSVKKGFLKLHKLKRKIAVLEALFNNVFLEPQQKRLWHRCFPAISEKFSATHFYRELPDPVQASRWCSPMCPGFPWLIILLKLLPRSQILPSRPINENLLGWPYKNFILSDIWEISGPNWIRLFSSGL